MDKEFYDKYSKDLECSYCKDLKHCINGKEPLKINCSIHYFKDKIADLEAKLAEKEKEETKRMEDFEKGCQEYYKSNQKAIAELEKVKELLIKNKHIALGAFDIAKRKESEIEVCRLDVAIYEIDQQIKSLKGEI